LRVRQARTCAIFSCNSAAVLHPFSRLTDDVGHEEISLLLVTHPGLQPAAQFLGHPIESMVREPVAHRKNKLSPAFELNQIGSRHVGHDFLDGLQVRRQPIAITKRCCRLAHLTVAQPDLLQNRIKPHAELTAQTEVSDFVRSKDELGTLFTH